VGGRQSSHSSLCRRPFTSRSFSRLHAIAHRFHELSRVSGKLRNIAEPGYTTLFKILLYCIFLRSCYILTLFFFVKSSFKLSFCLYEQVRPALVVPWRVMDFPWTEDTFNNATTQDYSFGPQGYVQAILTFVQTRTESAAIQLKN
jgi:hypothetical protein